MKPNTPIAGADVAAFDKWNADPVQLREELHRLTGKLAASEAIRVELVEALEDCADWLSRSTRTDDLEIASDARAALASARQLEGGQEAIS